MKTHSYRYEIPLQSARYIYTCTDKGRSRSQASMLNDMYGLGFAGLTIICERLSTNRDYDLIIISGGYDRKRRALLSIMQCMIWCPVREL